jgi:hypothetical protein
MGLNKSMSTITKNGYSTVPLRLPLLLDRFHRNLSHHQLGSTDTASRAKIKSAMVRFLNFRQKSKMAFLFYTMTVITFVSTLWVSQTLYLLCLGLFCLLGFLVLFATALQEIQACYGVLGKNPRKDLNLIMALRDILMYAWAHYRQNIQMRALITEALDESGFARTC